jgi:3-oxoadipate enol-lactonase
MLPRMLASWLVGACVIQSLAYAQGRPSAATFVQVNQTSLRYELSGTGPRVVVLLHELGMSLESWDDVVGELSQAHRVLRYDLRGFGLSEKLRGSVTIEDEVEDLRALLDRLGIAEPVTLVGGAVGGAIALRFAAAHPNRAAAVMALSPAGDVAPASRVAYLARAARLERLGMRPDVDATRDSSYPPTLQTGREDRLARYLALQYANDPISMAATLRMIAITEWADTWPAIQCPAWFIAVSRYAARPVDSVKAMASAVSRGHFEVLDTGPFVPLQSPELLLPLLRTFLRDTAR